MIGKEIQSIGATPKPDYLIKSIAEQGYSLETAIADLIDNSITAKASKVQMLMDTETEPFLMFLSDNGIGMSQEELDNNMRFPSSSPETKRDTFDLGRFGLGMKAASFSQTREFTVISRKKGSTEYNALTWDVEYLVKCGEWRLIVNSKQEIESILTAYRKLDKEFLNHFDNYEANTIVMWSGLYKFENYLEEQNRKNALNREIADNTTEHLGIVFHRFLENKKNPIQIRVNNTLVEAFNPFPESKQSLRKIEYKQKFFGDDKIKMEGFILPSSCIEEIKHGNRDWTTKRKSLLDMEGVYIYRADRLILFGGWNGLIKKAPKLQLARLRVDIGNNADHLLHLNVAKSAVIIPHDLIEAFKGYIKELKSEAFKEINCRGISKLQTNNSTSDIQLFTKIYSNKGPLLEVNKSFPLLDDLMSSMSQKQQSKLALFCRMVNTSINKVRDTHENIPFHECKEMIEDDLIDLIKQCQGQGFSEDFIKKNILSDLGIDLSTLPIVILNLLE